MSVPVDLPLSLDRGKPLATQFSTQIRALITGGVLATGDRLPSTRGVAADVGVSRGVLEVAYDQLLAEGWLSARTGAGTFVATTAPHPTSRRARPNARTSVEVSPARPPIRLDTGTPWIDDRYRGSWARAWRDVADATPPTAYPPAHGLPDLCTEIAGYAARTRGIACAPDQVMVTNGTTDGLRHLLGVLPSGSVAVEDPGYRAAAATTVTASAHRRHDIPVDEHGADLAARPVPEDLRALYVTPALRGRCSEPSCACCGTATSTGWSARRARCMPLAAGEWQRRSCHTAASRPRSRGCISPWRCLRNSRSRCGGERPVQALSHALGVLTQALGEVQEVT